MPGSQILHDKTRRVKLNGTGVVSCKTTNRKKVVNYRRCNKNVGKTKGAMCAGGTHGRDRKTRAICDHDGRRMRRRRVNGGECPGREWCGKWLPSRRSRLARQEVSGPWC